MKYRLYYFDKYGAILKKLISNNKIFLSIEECENFIEKQKNTLTFSGNIFRNNQIVICQKDKEWKIIKIINNEL